MRGGGSSSLWCVASQRLQGAAGRRYTVWGGAEADGLGSRR